MIPSAVLPVAASVLAVLAVAVGAWRGRGARRLLREGGTAAAVAAGAATLAVAAYALGRSPEARPWRNLGAALLLAAPLAAAAALRVRHGLPWVRGAIAGEVAAAGVFAWLLLSLRGPGGGWSAGAVVAAAACSALAVAAAVCAAAWTRRGAAGVLAVTVLAALGGAAACAGPESGKRGLLVLAVRDAASGEPAPARVELRGPDGRSWVPEGALPIAGDCGILPAHNWLPALAGPQVRARRGRSLPNPYRGTEQFYVDGEVAARLPPGRWQVRAWRGPERRVALRPVVVEGGATARVTLAPRRWIDLPAEGWVSADDHLHIPRPDPSLDASIATWMAAEDLHVANLLQMGLARDVHVTPQHGFGAAGATRRGTTLLVSGQENPRTHLLGHAIVLAAPRWIDFPERYLDYPRFWRRARDLGGVAGLAHFGLAGAGKALALWGETERIDFLEVENFGFGYWDRWYEALNLGLRPTPTAGTDYPCVPSLPGRDRFYARVGERFTLEGWLEAVRRGRTFVTNGPAIGLTVAGASIGDEVRLPAPGAVRVEGSVRFDPERDRMTALELVERGEVVHRVEGSGDEGELRLALDHPVAATTWLALRAVGVKRGEVRPPGLELLQAALDHPPPRPGSTPQRPELPGADDAPVANAHTAPVWVVVKGSPPLAARPEGRQAAAAWRSRLGDLEHWLAEQPPAGVVGFPGRGDGVPARLLDAHRAELLAAVVESRARLARSGASVDPSAGPGRDGE